MESSDEGSRVNLTVRMKFWLIIALATSLAAVHIDVYGDDGEIDMETVKEAKSQLQGTCQQGVEISNIEYYATKKYKYPDSLKISMEDTACQLDNVWDSRVMKCKGGSMTGATVTYMPGSVCEVGSNIKNFIATHVPTRKLSKLARFTAHLNMALKLYTGSCNKPLEPSCGIKENVMKHIRPGTPHFKKSGHGRYRELTNNLDSSDMDLDGSLFESGEDTDQNTPSSTTVTTETTTMSMNDTDYEDQTDRIFVPETPEGSEDNLSLDEDEDEPDKRESKAFEKVKTMAENLQTIANGFADGDDQFSDQDITIIVCISLSCLLIMANIVLQCVRSKAETIRALGQEVREMRESSRNLQNRLWSSPAQERSYV